MNAIVNIRKKILGMTQAELGAIAGVAQATVCRWEKGELHPNQDEMARIRGHVMANGKPWDDSWFFEAPVAAE